MLLEVPIDADDQYAEVVHLVVSTPLILAEDFQVIDDEEATLDDRAVLIALRRAVLIAMIADDCGKEVRAAACSAKASTSKVAIGGN